MQLLILAWIALTARFAAVQADDNRQLADDILIPRRYIVEFSDPDGLRKRAPPDGNHYSVFYNHLADNGIDANPCMNLTSTVFEGASFTADTNLNDLLALSQVKNVWPVERISLPQTVIHSVGADSLPFWSQHEHTGVLDLHKLGYLGQGAVVAIIDSGIDYNHPSLGGGIGPGFKVAGGKDIVGNDFLGKGFIPDDDPMDIIGHGTMVAGIVAASGDKNFVSVAPNATLRAYKIYSSSDKFITTGTDAIVAAMTMAYEDGADVINISTYTESSGSWAKSATAAIASRIASMGVFITMPPGNYGAKGMWYSGSGHDVISVASVDTESFPAPVAKISGNSPPWDMGYLPAGDIPFSTNGSLTFFATSADFMDPNDACEPLPETTPDLSRKLVLISLGRCTLEIKERYAALKGAKYIWFYSQEGNPVTNPAIRGVLKSKGQGMITGEVARKILADINAGVNITASFTDNQITWLPNVATGGKISKSSSWGPGSEGEISPEIAAPGGKIYTTSALEKGGHAVVSGTSFSAPYIAGIAALYIAASGGRAALGPAGMRELKSRIITSGALLNFNDGTKTDWHKFAPIAQQGGGYVNAKKVFYATSLLPGKLELKDTSSFVRDHYINVTNSGSEDVWYTLSHLPAATVNTFEDGSSDPQSFPPKLLVDSGNSSSSTAAVRFFPTVPFSLRPGETSRFMVSFTPPTLPPEPLPIYSGKIIVTGSNAETISLPYQGLAGSLKSVDIWELAVSPPRFLNEGTDEDILQPTNFTLKGLDRPAVIYNTHFPAAETRLDIVTPDWSSASWTYPPVQGKNQFLSSVSSYPLLWRTRGDPTGATSYNYYGWSGDLSNNTNIRPGSYRMLLSTLRPLGERGRAQDWIMALSGVITIV